MLYFWRLILKNIIICKYINKMSEINIPTFCNFLKAGPENIKTIKDGELKTLLEKGKPLFEWLDVKKAYKPYFDVDKYINTAMNEDDLQKETDMYVIDSKMALKTLFNDAFKVDLNLDTDFAVENSKVLNISVKCLFTL
jgi:hypothetical protein